MYVYSYKTQWVQWYNGNWHEKYAFETSSYRQRLLTRQYSVQKCLQASKFICRRGVPSRIVRRHRHTTSTNKRTPTLRVRPQDNRQTIHGSLFADYTRTHTVREQHCLGSHTPTGRTVRVVLRNATAVPRSHSGERLCCCYPREAQLVQW